MDMKHVTFWPVSGEKKDAETKSSEKHMANVSAIG